MENLSTGIIHVAFAFQLQFILFGQMVNSLLVSLIMFSGHKGNQCDMILKIKGVSFMTECGVETVSSYKQV
jgi:hypothetical protein